MSLFGNWLVVQKKAWYTPLVACSSNVIWRILGILGTKVAAKDLETETWEDPVFLRTW